MKFHAYIFAAFLVSPLSACAQDVEPQSKEKPTSLSPAQEVVTKVINGYGGAKFEELRTLRLQTDLRYGWLGQGQYADYTDLEPMRKIYHFDLQKEWGSEEAWGGGGSYAERVFTTDDGQYEVNYLNKTWELDEDAEFYGHFGGEIRGSDILLAYDLMKHRDTAEFSGAKMFRGVSHDLVTYDMPGTSIDPVLWVNSETGLISKMRRDVSGFGVLNYVFGNYQSDNGISFAHDFELYVDDKLVEYAKSVELSVGNVSPSIWKVDQGIQPMPETINSEDLVVDHISGPVHYAGSGAGWGAFVDAGDHIIGIGAYGDLEARFKAYQTSQGHQKPLKYQIVTHHHSDHLQGAAQALELGAQIIAPEMARANLEEVAERELSDAELMITSEAKQSIGPVELHLISTGHAPEFLLPYIASEKIILDEDHYYGQFKDSASWVSGNAMTLISEVQRLELKPDILLTTHARKPEKWQEILKMSERHIPGKCPTGRKICEDLIK